MAGRLEGKVALVLGAGGGMGLATPMLFAQEGAKVVLTARRKEPLDEIAERIRANDGEALVFAGDMTTEEGVAGAVEAAERTYGRLDILFNNLGDSASMGHGALDTSLADWQYLMAINLLPAYLGTRFAAPAMRRAGGGSIVHLAASPWLRMLGNPGYAAAKAGLEEYVRRTARELRADNIRVNCVNPGVQGITFHEGTVPLPPDTLARNGNAMDVAWPCLFLASREAAWVTGAVLTVDGGQLEIPEEYRK